MDHNEDVDKEIRISLSIFWDIATQGGNEVMRYLSNSFIYGIIHIKEVTYRIEVATGRVLLEK